MLKTLYSCGFSNFVKPTYAYVKEEAIPDGTSPIEMLVGNPESIDESEVTVYIPSLEDKTLAPPDGHVVMAIGPTFESWDKGHRQEYLQKKQKETQRLIAVLEKRFPGLGQAVIFSELATPCSIERYTLKNKGAVAGPKQMLGQHMFKRLHTRTEWNNFFCCGESTVMGTGTPTVTTSGISAANAVLKKLGKKTWTHQDAKKNYVSVVNGPVTGDDLYDGYSGLDAEIMKKAAYCQYCENPTCSEVLNLDIRGIMMRATVGNFTGARKIIERFRAEKDLNTNLLADSEKLCIQNQQNKRPVQIQAVIDYIGRK